jgi:hypothetical protein
VRKTIIIILCAMALAACESREDFPTELNIAPPPQPFNLSITTPTQTQYDLVWEIDDPNLIVDEYYIYLFTGLGPRDSLGTSSNTTFTWTSPFPIAGISFGVTSVTVQNVESKPEIETAP